MILLLLFLQKQSLVISFYLSHAYRDPTIPTTQYGGLCHVTLYHTYPLRSNHQASRTFSGDKKTRDSSRTNPPLACNKQQYAAQITRIQNTHSDRVITLCSPTSSHLDRPRLQTLLARVYTPCLPASSHLDRPRLHPLRLDHPRLHPLIARVCTPCSPASAHLDRPRLHP